ncbi:hypothetical protein MD484_g8099, partial [Candolleomyces efflorescens]
MAFTSGDAAYIGNLLSHLFLGVYATVFGLYLRLTWKTKLRLVIVDYGIILVFLLSVTTTIGDAVQQFFTLRRGGTASWIPQVNAATASLIGFIDFFAQIILIYRCWRVWNRAIWVAIIPSVLALVALILGMCATIDSATVPGYPAVPPKRWWAGMLGAAMGTSLAVNAVVSGLLITRIWLVHRENKKLGGVRDSALPLVLSALLQSAVLLFFAQLIFLVLYILRYRYRNPGFALVVAPIALLYGICCTAVMVRIRMNRLYELRVATVHSKLRFGEHGPADNTLPTHFVEASGKSVALKHLSTENSESTLAPRA